MDLASIQPAAGVESVLTRDLTSETVNWPIVFPTCSMLEILSLMLGNSWTSPSRASTFHEGSAPSPLSASSSASSSSSAPAHCFQYLITTGLGGGRFSGAGTVSGELSLRGVVSPLSHILGEDLRILTELFLTALASA